MLAVKYVSRHCVAIKCALMCDSVTHLVSGFPYMEHFRMRFSGRVPVGKQNIVFKQMIRLVKWLASAVKVSSFLIALVIGFTSFRSVIEKIPS